jgi:hypothetical protein
MAKHNQNDLGEADKNSFGEMIFRDGGLRASPLILSEENNHKGDGSKQVDADKVKGIPPERLEAIALFQALQAHLRDDIARNPKLASRVDKSLLSANPANMSDGEMQAALAAMREDAQHIDSDEDNHAVGGGIIEGVKRLFGRKDCHHNECHDNPVMKVVAVSMKELGTISSIESAPAGFVAGKNTKKDIGQSRWV